MPVICGLASACPGRGLHLAASRQETAVCPNVSGVAFSPSIEKILVCIALLSGCLPSLWPSWIIFFFFWFLAMPCSKQDLSSPALTRDWTCDSSSGSMESQPLNHQGSPWPSWILTPWGWSGQKENIMDPSEHDNWDLIIEGLRAGVLLGLVFLAQAAFLTGCWVLKTL